MLIDVAVTYRLQFSDRVPEEVVHEVVQRLRMAGTHHLEFAARGVLDWNEVEEVSVKVHTLDTYMKV